MPDAMIFFLVLVAIIALVAVVASSAFFDVSVIRQPSWEDMQEICRRERRREIADSVLPSLIRGGYGPEDAANKAYAVADAMMRKEAQ